MGILSVLSFLTLIFFSLVNSETMLYSLSISFSLQGNVIKLAIDPIFVVYTSISPKIGGFCIGNTVVINEIVKQDERVLQHELNHVKQYQALGDLFFLAGLLGVNLEGYPYYVTGPLEECNKAMWKPPDWWFFRWHFLELEFKLPNPIL